MSNSASEVAALPSQVEQVEDIEPQQTPEQSTKDQERSRKVRGVQTNADAKYLADAKAISEELRGLQGASIPAAEKGEFLERAMRDLQAEARAAESKKAELKQRKKALDEEYKLEKKRSKDQKKLKSKEEAQEKTARKNPVGVSGNKVGFAAYFTHKVQYTGKAGIRPHSIFPGQCKEICMHPKAKHA
ncbi:hypothetical protein GP486_007467 [Trichoglossum hirsutum]|uniref:Uncharacterized protein n=1 Tax=Trichoglossum hirsutum TaxID=265104 RepID=A0A9P8IBT4_9PEZI|nr:hypothetical protein GP486_007467 [Trichoglossum hirsutum]